MLLQQSRRRHVRLLSAGLPWLAAGILIMAVGCSQTETVREDRTISTSADGAIAIGMGPDGILVMPPGDGDADAISIPLPDKQAVGVSKPLWSPDGDKLVFVTARLDDDSERPDWEREWIHAPGGTISGIQPIRYTCWLCRVEEPGEPPSAPVELFHGRLLHLGYVTGNLAVNWKSDDELIYVDSTEATTVELFSYNVATKSAERFSEFDTAAAVVFDIHANGSVVALAQMVPDERGSIAMVTSWDRETQWHIWDTKLAPGVPLDESAVPLGWLQRSRPQWNPTGTHFHVLLGMDKWEVADRGPVAAKDQAEVAEEGAEQPNPNQRNDDQPNDEPPNEEQPVHTPRQLWVADVTQRSMHIVDYGLEPMADVHWHPNQPQLAWLRGAEFSPKRELLIHDLTLGQSQVEVEDAAQFAGWTSDGTQIVFTRRLSPSNDSPNVGWFGPRSDGNFSLVARVPSSDVERTVLSHVRLDFPTTVGGRHGEQSTDCAAWLTIPPTLEISSQILPATTTGIPVRIDVDSGDIRWLDVGLTGTVHRARYTQRIGEHAEAIRLFRRAEKDLAAMGDERDVVEIPALSIAVSWHAKGDLQKARQANRTYQAGDNRVIAEWLSESGIVHRYDEVTAMVAAVQTLEAYLAARRSDLAEQWFAQAPADESIAQLVARQTIAAQLSLMRGDVPAYADVVTEELFPRWRSQSQIELPDNEDRIREWLDGEVNEGAIVDLWIPFGTIGPLFQPRTLNLVPTARRAVLAKAWREYEFSSHHPHHQLACQLVLRAIAHADGNTALIRDLEQQISMTPLWQALTADMETPFKALDVLGGGRE